MTELLGGAGAEIKAELEQELRDLAFVTVMLPLASPGFSSSVQSDILVVGELEPLGEAQISLRLDPGFIVRSVGGVGIDPREDEPLSSVIAKVRSAASDSDKPLPAKVAFVFERPLPPLPVRGWARKALRRLKQFRFTENQKTFLDECFAGSLNGGECIRDKRPSR